MHPLTQREYNEIELFLNVVNICFWILTSSISPVHLTHANEYFCYSVFKPAIPTKNVLMGTEHPAMWKRLR